MAQELDIGYVKGPKGDTGQSQYDIAVSGGYTGTLAEYERAAADMPVHMEDSVIHVTQGNRDEWNGKVNAPTHVTTAILPTWTGSYPYTQTIAVPGVTPNCTVDVRLAAAASVQAAQQYQVLGLQDGGQAAGIITLKAFGALNTVDIPISVTIGGDG